MNKIIEYSQYQTDINKRVKELTWSRGKPCVIISAIAFPIAVFLTVMGHISGDKEGLIMGYSALALAVVFLALYIALFFSLKKLMCADFSKCVKDGKVDYALERVGDTFKLVRRADEYEFRFDKLGVQKMDVRKTIIVLYLKDKRIVTLPTREDIIELLNAPLGE